MMLGRPEQRLMGASDADGWTCTDERAELKTDVPVPAETSEVTKVGSYRSARCRQGVFPSCSVQYVYQGSTRPGASLGNIPPIVSTSSVSTYPPRRVEHNIRTTQHGMHFGPMTSARTIITSCLPRKPSAR